MSSGLNPAVTSRSREFDPERRHFLATTLLTLASAELVIGSAVAASETKSLTLPVIAVPTITLQGDADGAPRPDPSAYANKLSGKYSHRAVEGGIGHNLPQEAPRAFAQAVVDVDTY
ncbi:hypothetical protein D3C85_724900 [compost metagenome]